jgi:hypothetical protein
MSVQTARHSAAVRRVSKPVVGLVAAVILAAAITVAVVVARSGGGETAPYRDAAATGRLALCDANGKQITSGSVTAAPFAWRAVGTSAAAGAYATGRRTATLYVYQPRPGAPADDWSGRQLTVAAQYTNVAHPMAQATKADTDLHDFLLGYPTLDKGFLQLRLILGAAEVPPQTTRYDSLDIKIAGNSWHAVDAPPATQASCTDGKAVSLETLLNSQTNSP